MALNFWLFSSSMIYLWVGLYQSILRNWSSLGISPYVRKISMNERLKVKENQYPTIIMTGSNKKT